MQRLPPRWFLRTTFILVVMLLAFNAVVILAQDAPPEVPTEVPTDAPTDVVTEVPTEVPTDVPTDIPTEAPTDVPTDIPTEVPTDAPTDAPTDVPTEVPTDVGTTEPTAAPTAEPEPALSLLVRDLFNTGDFSSWEVSAGWSFVPNEGALAFQTTGNDAAKLLKGQFFNVAVEARFLISSGAAQISLRQSAAGNYTAALDAAGNLQLLRAGIPVAQSTTPVVATATGWHVLRVSAINGTVRVAVDGIETIVFLDSAPLPPGDVTLSGNFPLDANGAQVLGALLAEDFFLWVPTAEFGMYPSPTPQEVVTEAPATDVPTQEPTAELPTAEPTEEVTAVPTEVVTEEPGVVPEGKQTEMMAPPTAEQLIGIEVTGNDNFGSAFSIPSANPLVPYNDNGDSTANTVEGSEPNPTCGQNVGYTFWYTFNPTITANYLINTAGSGYDTVLAVYTGASLGGLTQVYCNDDASTSLVSSSLNVSLTAGTTYRIKVGGYNGSYGQFNFHVEQVGIAVPAAPVLTTPVAGITTADQTVTLNWNATTTVGSGFKYEVQVDDVSTFTNPLIYTATTASLNTTTTSLAAGANGAAKTYYWRVRTLNINGVPGNFTAYRAFAIRTAGPAQSAPADNAVLTTVRPTFTWVAYAGATYQVEVDDNINFSGVNFTFTPAVPTALTVAANQSIPQGTWYWRVKATDVLGNIIYSATRAFSVNILLQPVNNALTITATTANINLSWAVAAGTTGYKVQVANTPDFLTGLVEYDIAAGIVTKALTAQPAGVYYWRVQIGGVDTAPPPFYRKFTISPAAPAAPILVAPNSGAVIYDQTPKLDWNDSTSTLGTPYTYDVLVATTGTFTPASIVLNNQNVATSEFTFPTNLNPATYYWKVRTVNTYGVAGAYSMVRNFIVRINNLSAPVDNAVITTATTANVTFTWTATSDAVAYQLETASDPILGPWTPQANPPTALTYTLTNLPAGVYFWRVKVDIGAGFPAGDSAYRKFTISPAAPVAPILVAPNTGVTLADTTPALDWNDSVSTLGTPYKYDLLVAKLNTFTPASIVLDQKGIATSNFTLTTPLPPGTYYWKVRTVNAYGVPSAAYSLVRSFIVRTVGPTLTLLADGATVTTARPTFTWVAYAGGTYEIQIASDTGFTTNVVNRTAPASATPKLILDTSLNQGLWYWRVRALDVLGNPSDYSVTRSFTLNILSLPANNTVYTTATTYNATVSWVAVAYNGVGTTNYRLQVDDNSAFSSPTNYDQTATSKAFTGLAAGKYYWRVLVDTGAGFAPAAPPYRLFTVSPAALGAPGMVNPTAAKFLNDSTPTFDWTAPAGADGTTTYELYLARNSAFTTDLIIRTGLTGTTYTLDVPLTTNGAYYWKMRTVNQHGVPGAFNTPRIFTFDNVAPAKPTLSAPANNATVPLLQPTFTWVAVAGAAKYAIQINTAPLTDGTFASYPTVANFKPATPLNTGTNYWRVKAIDAAGNESPWSDTRIVKITSATSDVPILNRFTVATPNLTWAPISWTAGGGHYEVVVSTDKVNFTNPVYTNNAIAAPSTGITTTAIPNGTWFWRVRACDPTSHCGAWSTAGTFIIEVPNP